MSDKIRELAEKMSEKSVPPHWIKETTNIFERILRAELKPLLDAAEDIARRFRVDATKKLATELQGWRKD